MNTFLIIALSLIFICAAWIIRILLVRNKAEKTEKILLIFDTLRKIYKALLDVGILAPKEVAICFDHLNSLLEENKIVENFQNNFYLLQRESFNLDSLHLRFEIGFMSTDIFLEQLAKFEKRYFGKVLLPRFQSQEEFEINFAENELKEELEITFEDKEKEEAKPPTSPDEMYGLLGVDALSIHVGKYLVELADPEKGGQLVPDIGLLRQHMTLIYGYILPPVRIAENKDNELNEYKIVIRGNAVSTSTVYPTRYMILKSHWDKTFDKPPDEFVQGIEPTLKEKAYWLKTDYLNKLIEDKSWTWPYLTAVQAITYHLMETVIANIEQLFTKVDLCRVLDQVRSMNPALVDNLIPHVLNIGILRKVLINLIREKVSIKDIHYILENLEDLATETTNADLLSERLRVLLYRQISATNAIDNKKILAIKLDYDLEEKLIEFLQIVNHQAILVLPPEQAVSLVTKILDVSRDINSEYNRRPVVLTAKPSIRLPLARLIHGSENQTAVMGYAELSSDFRPEILNTIGLNDLTSNNLANEASSEEENQPEEIQRAS